MRSEAQIAVLPRPRGRPAAIWRAAAPIYVSSFGGISLGASVCVFQLSVEQDPRFGGIPSSRLEVVVGPTLRLQRTQDRG